VTAINHFGAKLFLEDDQRLALAKSFRPKSTSPQTSTSTGASCCSFYPLNLDLFPTIPPTALASSASSRAKLGSSSLGSCREGCSGPERFGCCHGSDQARGVIASFVRRAFGRTSLCGVARIRQAALAAILGGATRAGSFADGKKKKNPRARALTQSALCFFCLLFSLCCDDRARRPPGAGRGAFGVNDRSKPVARERLLRPISSRVDYLWKKFFPERNISANEKAENSNGAEATFEFR